MSQKVKRIGYTLDYTASYAVVLDVPTLTVTTSSAHNLATGDLVTLTCSNTPQEITAAVTVVDATHFTISDVKAIDFKVGKVRIEIFRAAKDVVISLPRTTAADAIIQTVSLGANGATYSVLASLDGVHFESIASVTHTTDGESKSTKIPANWAFVKVSISAVGATTKLIGMYSA